MTVEVEPCADGDHEVETTDEADGVIGAGAAHVFVSVCTICGAEMTLTEPDEDGDSHWERA